MAGPALDVAVVGAGPAGLALARACARLGLATAVVGDGRPWTATYGTWCDDVPDVPADCFGHVSAAVVVHGTRRHVVHRAYGVVANDALRAHLAAGLDVGSAAATGVQHFAWGSRVATAAGAVDARLVVDAAGAAGLRRAPARATTGGQTAGQTAFGIVVDEPPAGFDEHRVTLMDLRATDSARPPTFAYVVPVPGGWLVEETVLAARPMVPPPELEDRLVARLGPAGRTHVATARRVELVAIPMGGAPPRRGAVVAFGAAAGYVHPATGYSVAASLRAAPRVAAAIAAATGAGRTSTRPVWDAVWPGPQRRTRRLHRAGLEVLLGLDRRELATFFDAFFELPVERWSSYLRVDAPPRAVAATMVTLARRLPWSLRRRLVPLGR